MSDAYVYMQRRSCLEMWRLPQWCVQQKFSNILLQELNCMRRMYRVNRLDIVRNYELKRWVGISEEKINIFYRKVLKLVGYVDRTTKLVCYFYVEGGKGWRYAFFEVIVGSKKKHVMRCCWSRGNWKINSKTKNVSGILLTSCKKVQKLKYQRSCFDATKWLSGLRPCSTHRRSKSDWSSS